MTIATGSLIVAWLILVGAVYGLTFRVQRLMDLAESIVNERATVPEPRPEKFLGVPMVTDTVETARIVEADLDRLLDHPSRGRHSAAWARQTRQRAQDGSAGSGRSTEMG